MSESYINGTFKILILYDMAEEIELDEVRRVVGALPSSRESTLKHVAAEYVRLELKL